MDIYVDIFDYSKEEIANISSNSLICIALSFGHNNIITKKSLLVDFVYNYIQNEEKRNVLLFDVDSTMIPDDFDDINVLNTNEEKVSSDDNVNNVYSGDDSFELVNELLHDCNESSVVCNQDILADKTAVDGKIGFAFNYDDCNEEIEQYSSVKGDNMTVKTNNVSEFDYDEMQYADLPNFEARSNMGEYVSDDIVGFEVDSCDKKPVEKKDIINCINVLEARELLRKGEVVEYSGVLESNQKGFGFLRHQFYFNSDKDSFVDSQIMRYLHLRDGDYIKAVGRKSMDKRVGCVTHVLSVNGVSVTEPVLKKNFEDLLPIFPDEKLRLEASCGRSELAIRCIDLFAPIGKGQRALIVSPPKAGKTTLLKQIANCIVENNPDVKVFVLLIDERPEEVTDMQRSINADVIYSTFDETPERHIHAAETVLKTAKRYVESGKDAVIVLDSITRLARAYNLVVEHSGRSLTGGLAPNALSIPKKFFGSARNIEGGGSLTIIATALVDTGSKLDDVIFEEFKGTGNMEVVLDRRLSEKRIFPAIDLSKSSTRREDLLLSENELIVNNHIRKLLDSGRLEVVDDILNKIYDSNNNYELVKKYVSQIEALNKQGYVFRNNK